MARLIIRLAIRLIIGLMARLIIRLAIRLIIGLIARLIIRLISLIRDTRVRMSRW